MAKDNIIYADVGKDRKAWLEAQALKEDRPVVWVLKKLIDEAMEKEAKKVTRRKGG